MKKQGKTEGREGKKKRGEIKEEREREWAGADKEEGVKMVRELVLRELGRKYKQKTKKNGPCVK